MTAKLEVEVEVVVNVYMDGQEALGMPRRPKALHRPLALRASWCYTSPGMFNSSSMPGTFSRNDIVLSFVSVMEL